ncbi:ABC transporter [candidate division MSBL1 archaeon SCGC-AAA382C18]|uniref:ABC transporter n=1 Tax=candidate division MSBL1 archaeon SCGC-AAA382C18 TaxID=1698281 RepID=A0A133VJ63_9EURY|nr:ABC transporter [candidate division MSBL1 archaeon SCGC-AAA382C18]
MQYVLALIMTAFIGSASGYIGSLMVTKRMALTGGALGHLTLPGVALALKYSFDVSIGAFVILIVGVLLIWAYETTTGIPMEALTAVVFSSSVSIAFLFLPEKHAVPALIGDISQISEIVTIIAVILSLLVVLMTKKIYPKMLMSGISEDIAESEGINVEKYNLIYLIGIALIIALGVRVVGSLLTAALVAIPATAGRNISKNHFQYTSSSLIFGAISCIIGVSLYKLTGPSIWSLNVGSPGPLIIITSTAFFLTSLVAKKFRE